MGAHRSFKPNPVATCSTKVQVKEAKGEKKAPSQDSQVPTIKQGRKSISKRKIGEVKRRSKAGCTVKADTETETNISIDSIIENGWIDNAKCATQWKHPNMGKRKH